MPISTQEAYDDWAHSRIKFLEGKVAALSERVKELEESRMSLMQEACDWAGKCMEHQAEIVRLKAERDYADDVPEDELPDFDPDPKEEIDVDSRQVWVRKSPGSVCEFPSSGADRSFADPVRELFCGCGCGDDGDDVPDGFAFEVRVLPWRQRS